MSLVFAVCSYADEHGYRRLPSKTHITGLNWLDEEATPKEDAVILKGVFIRPNWSLHAGKALVKPKSDGTFRLLVRTPTAKTTLKLEAIGPKGAHETEVVEVEATLVAEVGFAKSDFYIDPSVGFSLISYSQTGLADTSQTGVTPKLAAGWHIDENWEIGANVFFNALVFAGGGQGKTQFFGGNFKVGYGFNLDEAGAWRLGIFAGAYYTTMLGNSGYGFNNLFGPQLFPTLRYELGKKNAVFVYGKYSPIAQGSSILGLANRELAVGGGWQRALGNGNPLAITLDYASDSFTLSGITIGASSLTLGAGYGFR